MIVIDTNVIAYLYFEGEHTTQVEKLYEKESHWVAPVLWRSEFRNVLALYIRKKIISLENSFEMMEQAERLMDGNEYTVSSQEVLKLVKSSSCSAYDCEFVCLAKELSIPLITEDKKILNNFPNETISLLNFSKTYVN